MRLFDGFVFIKNAQVFEFESADSVIRAAETIAAKSACDPASSPDLVQGAALLATLF
ncbi:hypothetical protein D3C71_2199650 [compost metagenome]